MPYVKQTLPDSLKVAYSYAADGTNDAAVCEAGVTVRIANTDDPSEIAGLPAKSVRFDMYDPALKLSTVTFDGVTATYRQLAGLLRQAALDRLP